MELQFPIRRKGLYLGTEVGEKWWKRYTRDKFFARGNGKYWFDNSAFYFHRYLTRKPIQIPFDNVVEVKLGRSHAGRWLLRVPVLKIIWKKSDLLLSSGFLVSKNPLELERILADIRQRIST